MSRLPLRLRLSASASLALLLGLHGLLFAAIFPLGPQVARRWSPGIFGFAALACALPFAAALSGLVVRRAFLLPRSPRTLALVTAAAALPAALAQTYSDLLIARLIGGIVLGVAVISALRLISPVPGSARVAPLVTILGLPLCSLAATAFDLRAAFALILLAALALAVASPSDAQAETLPPAPRETARAGLVANAALSFVSTAYLTVVSGFLVFNAGHTEWHIGAVLTLAAVLNFALPPALRVVRRALRAPAEFEFTLLVSALSLTALLAISRPCPAWIAVPLLAFFLNANAARHVALAGLVATRVDPADQPGHRLHAQLANYVGAGLGCVCAGLVVHIEPDRGLVGMPTLLACALAATAIAAACPRFLPTIK